MAFAGCLPQGFLCVHEMIYSARDGAYVDATGLARGRRHALPPWPDQEAHEGKDGVANEALAKIYLAKDWNRCS